MVDLFEGGHELFESVYIPVYFDSTSIIHSYYLNKLFNNEKMCIKTDQEGTRYFSIEMLRILYREDKDRFNKTVLELTLRGFKITNTKNTSIFPKSYVTTHSKIIGKSTLENNLSVIDFRLLHLGLLLNNFKIESSHFFENIPLEGFLSINQHVNLNLLESELVKAGFDIQDEGYLNIDGLVVTKDVKDTGECELNIDIPEILQIIYEKKYLHYIMLNQIISDEKKIIEYFKNKNIHYVHELIKGEVEEFYNKDAKLCEELLHSIKKSFSGKKFTPYLVDAFTKMYMTGFSSKDISDLFELNKFNAIKNYLFKQKIHDLYEFTPDNFREFSKLKGIGIGKILDILDAVQNYTGDGTVSASNWQLENLKEAVEPVKKIYLSKYLSATPFWLDTIVEKNNFIDEKNLKEAKSIVKLNLGGKRKQIKKINQEIEASIQKIDSINISEVKTQIQFDEKFKKIKTIEFLNIIGGISHEPSIDQAYRNELMELMSLSLGEIDKLCFSGEDNRGKINISSLFKQLLWMIQGFQYSIENFDNLIISDLKEIELIVYQERILNNQILEEVGKKIGVTRERIRQVEAKLKIKIKDKMDYRVFPGIRLYFYFELDKFVFLNQLKMPGNLIQLLKENNDTINYHKKLELVYLSSTENQKIITDVEKLFSDLPIVMDKKRLTKKIENRPNFSTNTVQFLVDNLDRIIRSFGYCERGEKIVLESTSLEQQLYSLVNLFDQHTFDLSNKVHLEQFRKNYELYFPKDHQYIECSDEILTRKIRGSLERNQQIILKSAATFMIYDFRKLPHILINHIYDYLIIFFEDEVVISYKKIYMLFQQELEQENITPYMVYYLLKYCYEKEFSFGKGNTMYIFASGAEKNTTEEIIYNKVVANGGKIKKQQISDELGFDLYTIEQAASRSNKLTAIDGYLNATDFNLNSISEVFKLAVQNLAETHLEEYQFIIIEKMFYELKFDGIKAKEMLNANIINTKDLLRMLKMMYPNLQGHMKFLYRKEYPVNTSDVILADFKIGEKYTLQNLLEKAQELGYSTSTTYVYSKEWRRTDRIIEIDEEHFVLPGSITITRETIEKIKVYLNQLLENNSYKALYKLKGFRRNLPKIRPYNWTPELIRYVGKKAGFRFIELNNVIHNLDPIIVLHPELSNLTYADLIRKAMNSYKGNLHKEDVYHYLIEKGLIVPRKKVPIEIPEEILSENIIQVNEIGIIESKEVRIK